ncbi:hypothetical protein [Moellerella wisconsensis]|uniref:hypothetical protein n=1 Tax=Moellerella wisconsensis TaxID=158849 RepID=UPI003075F1A5
MMVYVLIAIIVILLRFLYVLDNNNRTYLWKLTNKMIVMSDSLNIVTSPHHLGSIPVLILTLVKNLEHNRAAAIAYLQLNIPNSPEANTIACELRYTQASAKQGLCRVVVLLVDLERKGQNVCRLVDTLRVTDLDADDVYTALDERYPSGGQHTPLLLLSDSIPGHWDLGGKK